MVKSENVLVTMRTDNKIVDLHDNNVSKETFRESIDSDKMEEFINTLPLYDDAVLDTALYDFLIDNKEVFGIRHCDTYEDVNFWRVQLQIHICVYPEVVQLLENKTKNYTTLLENNTLMILEFWIKKKDVHTN